MQRNGIFLKTAVRCLSPKKNSPKIETIVSKWTAGRVRENCCIGKAVAAFKDTKSPEIRMCGFMGVEEKTLA